MFVESFVKLLLPTGAVPMTTLLAVVPLGSCLERTRLALDCQ